MMKYKMLMKSKEVEEERNRNAVQVIIHLIKEYDKDPFMPPIQFLQENLTEDIVLNNNQFPGESKPFIELFMEYLRLRPFADRLAKVYRKLFKKVTKYPVADFQTASIILYILSGFLHPSNQEYIERFIRAVRLELLATMVFALEQMTPVNKFYYLTLVKTNMYSFEFIEPWYYKDQKYPGFAEGYLEDIKRRYIKVYGNWLAPGTVRSGKMSREYSILESGSSAGTTESTLFV